MTSHSNGFHRNSCVSHGSFLLGNIGDTNIFYIILSNVLLYKLMVRLIFAILGASSPLVRANVRNNVNMYGIVLHYTFYLTNAGKVLCCITLYIYFYSHSFFFFLIIKKRISKLYFYSHSSSRLNFLIKLF